MCSRTQTWILAQGSWHYHFNFWALQKLIVSDSCQNLLDFEVLTKKILFGFLGPRKSLIFAETRGFTNHTSQKSPIFDDLKNFGSWWLSKFFELWSYQKSIKDFWSFSVWCPIVFLIYFLFFRNTIIMAFCKHNNFTYWIFN